MATVNIFKNYLSEKLGGEFIVEPNGFAMYMIEEDYILLADVHVEKDHRRTGLATKLLKQVEDIAKKNELKYIMCECQLKDGSPQEAVATIVQYFKPVKANNDMITFVREVK